MEENSILKTLNDWKNLVVKSNVSDQISQEELPEEELPEDIRDIVMYLRKKLDYLGIDRSTLVPISLESDLTNNTQIILTISYDYYLKE